MIFSWVYQQEYLILYHISAWICVPVGQVWSRGRFLTVDVPCYVNFPAQSAPSFHIRRLSIVSQDWPAEIILTDTMVYWCILWRVGKVPQWTNVFRKTVLECFSKHFALDALDLFINGHSNQTVMHSTGITALWMINRLSNLITSHLSSSTLVTHD